MSPRYLWMLLVLAVVLITLLQVAESQEDPAERRRRRQQRRRNQLARRRNRDRNRNRNRNSRRGRNRRTTTTAIPGGATSNTITTTEYPPECEEIYLPMCKGFMSYTHTKLPNQFNHTTQAQVYQELEHKWAYIDHSCSANTRQLICSIYLPKCVGSTRPAEGPCRRTCMLVRRRCTTPFRETFGIQWGDHFSCRGLPRNTRCIGAQPEVPCNRQYSTCINITSIPVCAGLTFSYGTLPNLYQQCQESEIIQELDYYNALRASNCHANLNFLLCGVHTPFCIRGDIPLAFPCRELCEEVKTACETTYQRLYHNLPWPNKLQCHRFPATTSTNGMRCVMPNEGTTFGANGKR